MDRLGVARVVNRVAAMLAALALILPVLVPSGFMVSPTSGGPAIVVCTGQGPLVVHPGDAGKRGSPSRSHDGHACAFAGHGGAAPTQALFAVTRAHFEPFPGHETFGIDLLPGRGLAAPPPPSHGPPILLI